MYNIELPSKELLKNLSYTPDWDKNLHTVSLKKISLLDIKKELFQYRQFLFSHPQFNEIGCMRVKSESSVELKYNKYINRGSKIVLCLNDLLGLRIYLKEYPEEYPEHFKIVDLRSGKQIDDGYRAVHLYYYDTHFSFPIEVQIWAEDDVDFNQWSHMSGYKLTEPKFLHQLRKEYDDGLVSTEETFIKRMEDISREH